MANLNGLRKRLLKTIDLPYICAYCGEPADHREHVFPKSIVGENTPKVWACAECNMLAGAALFDTFEDKRDYIKAKLLKRYDRYFRMPNWSDDEIEELSHSLRTTVIEGMEGKKWIQNRINWSESLSALVVAKTLSSIATGKDFAQISAEVTRTEMNALKLSVCIESLNNVKLVRQASLFDWADWNDQQRLQRTCLH